MKYVMLERRVGPTLRQRLPIIFPDELIHADVAVAVVALCEGMQFAKPVSAGQVRFTNLGADCYGESTTLQLKPHPDDVGIIDSHDYEHGLI